MLELNGECRNYIESSAVMWADGSLACTSYAAKFRQPIAEHPKEYSLLKVLKWQIKSYYLLIFPLN
ncbi:MAG: hypothetical protein ACI82Q_001673 [Nonlabens sp.]|jgi:hypothetical protein